MISPFSAATSAHAWSDLELEYQEALKRIAAQSSLALLVQPDNKHDKPLLYRHFVHLKAHNLVWLKDASILLTADGKRMIERYASTTAQDTGDDVTIIGLRPNVGRTGYTRAYWLGLTDDKDYPFIHLYSEDFTALTRAGYKLPGWNDRAPASTDCDDDLMDIALRKVSGFDKKTKRRRPVEAAFPCAINVRLYAEQVNGHWRIAQALPPDGGEGETIDYLRVSYDQLTTGDTFLLGTADRCQVISISSPYQGERQGTVKDSDGIRAFTWRSHQTYTLCSGKLLERARRREVAIEWRGSGWCTAGERKAG